MTTAIRWTAVLSVFVCAALFLVESMRWPLVGDSTLMHYVVFLMQKGFVPYRQIVDINLPGTYLTEWAAMHLFGAGDLAWRLFDLALDGAVIAAMVLIAWPIDRFAGIFAGLLFVLLHGRDGIADLGQRDLLMTVCLLWSLVCLLHSLRKGSMLLLGIAGALTGFAGTVKPTAVFFWFAVVAYLLISRIPPPPPRSAEFSQRRQYSLCS